MAGKSIGALVGTLTNPIDENDDFYIKPKDANSRGDCPHEIGSDAWLEWQRQFAWAEYTKPSGQERVEAAYQRLKERGFQIVQKPSFDPYQPAYGSGILATHGYVNFTFVTNRLSTFTENVRVNDINSRGTIQVPRFHKSNLAYTPFDPTTPSTGYSYAVETFHLKRIDWPLVLHGSVTHLWPDLYDIFGRNQPWDKNQMNIEWGLQDIYERKIKVR